MNKVLLLNFNGTIVDTKDLAINIYNKIADKQGYKTVSKDQVAEFRSLSIRERCKLLDVPIYKMPLVGISIKRQYQKYIPDLGPIPSIKEVLNNLKQKGYKLAFTTSNKQSETNQFLINNSLDIFTYEHYSFNPFTKSRDIASFLKKNNLLKENVIYIGDELRDIEAAKKNGLFCIAVSWGYDSKELLQKGNADYVVDQPEDIIGILSRA
ncbi:hypothetical protein ASG61_21025 [Bacillus sp. Leaf75]|nr:hypothetical protein ASG61_21025 [Bacillus sp. Leaf75]